MASAAAVKSLRSKVSISIVSIIIGILFGVQLNILRSLHGANNLEVKGDSFLEGGHPHDRRNLAKETVTTTDVNDEPPSYLKWHDISPKPHSDWSFTKPQWCNCESCNEKWQKKAPITSMNDTTEKIIVHYHMQHNAGTNFYDLAHAFVPCATRACWQIHKHCFISYNQEVEAENIRRNYYQHGVQYVSYETMLPPRFPLPFVSETARDGLFFTTIMRNPMKRLITWLRHLQKSENIDKIRTDEGLPPDFFWSEMEGNRGPYKRENLNVRWLSGALDDITSDSVNIAKCRLQLFDLVIVDTMYDAAVNDVVCPLNNWEGRKYCNSAKKRREHISKKPNPFQETDSHFVGAWIERLRPSFELYDYARILSFSQLKERGVKDLPELSDVPSYIATLASYSNATLNIPKDSRVNLKNIDRFHPQKEFCDEMKLIWSSNADEIPFIKGIGSLGKDRVFVSHG